MLAPVPLVIVHLPSKPEPQSDVFTHEAVTAAAEAELAVTAIPPSTISKAPPHATRRRLRSLDIVLPNRTKGLTPRHARRVGTRLDELARETRDLGRPDLAHRHCGTRQSSAGGSPQALP